MNKQSQSTIAKIACNFTDSVNPKYATKHFLIYTRLTDNLENMHYMCIMTSYTNDSFCLTEAVLIGWLTAIRDAYRKQTLGYLSESEIDNLAIIAIEKLEA